MAEQLGAAAAAVAVEAHLAQLVAVVVAVVLEAQLARIGNVAVVGQQQYPAAAGRAG